MSGDPVDGGNAEFLRDADRPAGWLLLVDGVPQSYVDPGDLTYLDFDYVRLIADVLDVTRPPPTSVSVIHVGGAGLTLPRWVTATRPRSRQLVLEPDELLTALVRERLPLPRASGIRVRPTDGRSGIMSRPDASADVVVLDAFSKGRVPPDLTTREYVVDVARVLRTDGVYVANVADAPPLTFARRFTATVRDVFAEVAVLAEPSILRGRRFGNLIVVGSARLPVEALMRQARKGAFPARVLTGDDVTRFVGGAAPLLDGEVSETAYAEGLRSPEPPTGTWRIPRV